jgi:hypothetical protein
LLALIDSCTTGIDASGKACTSTDQVPWSMPQLSTSAPTQVGWTTSLTSSASSGNPGAGYWTSKSASGKPKKSWMVRGRGIAVTAVALMYQGALITRMARGRTRPVSAARDETCRTSCGCLSN